MENEQLNELLDNHRKQTAEQQARIKALEAQLATALGAARKTQDEKMKKLASAQSRSRQEVEELLEQVLTLLALLVQKYKY